MYTLQNSNYEMILYTMEPRTVVTEIKLHARKNGEGGEYPNFSCTITFSYHIILNSTCMLTNAVNLYKYGTVL